MSITVQIALFGFLPLVLGLFALLPVRPAILSGMVLGWMFLPIAKLPVVGVPDYDKIVATNAAVFLGCLLFYGKGLFQVRLKWLDLPILLWMLSPSLASLSNELGLYDAGSMGVRHFLVWVLPYWVGRAYFTDGSALRLLVLSIVIGCLVYVPFCLFEVRMSPQLHNLVYGFHQNQFWRNIRFDGFRPIVFMNSGLMVGSWMATGTIAAFWLWMSGVRRLGRVPLEIVFAVLFVTTVLCKALYAILLMLAAICLLWITRNVRTRLPMVLLVVAVPAYMVARGTQAVPAEVLTEPAARWFGENRAQSLGARLYQEDVMITHAMHRPVFGWGGWKRAWPIDPDTGKHEVRGVDGLWTITISETGFYGLTTLFATLLVPVVVSLARHPPQTWDTPAVAGIAIAAVSLLLFTCDCLLNGMFNPMYVLIAGALTSTTAPARAGRQSLATTTVLGTPARRPLVARNLRRVNGRQVSA
jgi:hypothetical protein